MEHAQYNTYISFRKRSHDVPAITAQYAKPDGAVYLIDVFRKPWMHKDVNPWFAKDIYEIDRALTELYEQERLAMFIKT